MKKHFRLVVFLLVLSLLFSLGYAALESGHDCHGEDCPICKIIALLPTVWGAACLAFVLLQAGFVLKKTVFVSRREKLVSVTPTDLCVKLLN